MKSLLYASFLPLILVPICLLAQQPAPSIQWQQVYGGSMDDQARDLELTPDGGCIFTGYTSSEDHDVTVNQGGDDVWVVKLTSEGIIEWQKSLGGNLKDWGRSVTLTNDGGYLITGYEKSTDGELSDNHGAYDLLVIKLNSSGDVLWDKELGGSFDDNGYCAIVTSDNGYLIGGYTLSSDGDVSGNHGMEDFWVIKLDNNGNYEWQKTLGGSGFEEISNMIQTSDGNYLIAGYTNSTDGDITMNHGSYDFWIVKLSTIGELIYEKTYGGTKEDGARDIIAAPDGGYIIAGYSFSDNFDVTENHGKSDVWVIKVDVSGNLEWQKSYGGTEDDYCYTIAATNSGNYILAGNSNSSNGTLTSNKGLSDYWVLEINSGGDLIWQRSLGGSDDDVARNIKQTPTGEYLVSGYTLSNNGDVTNNYGGYDCWLISLCTSALYFFDADLDGYGNPDLPLTSCSAPSGFVLTNTDCNDSDAAINPQAGEMCNSIDDDCDGQTDEDLACTGDDEDADGYTITDGDCNDMDPTINPGAAEVCNSIDDNCNAQVDEGVKTKYFADADGDQYGDVNTYFFSCIEFSGYVTDSTDCNDNDATINISSIEICNGIDDNCNGFTDEVESIYYADGDGDGYGDPNTSVTVQSCTAPTDFVDNNLDCNDADLAIYAGATEICNQIDDDCDGQTDEDLICDGADVDGDGYAVNQGDCNDSDPTINPGAAETCNSIDDNCNAQIDEGVQIQYFADADGDLFGDANNYIYSCIASTGYVADNTDCNDNDATINSSSPEICNGIDDNCNGFTDEVQGTYYADVDADGYGN
nr:putative metal-binding motif-containing protein [Chitinophagales bacterium]